MELKYKIVETISELEDDFDASNMLKMYISKPSKLYLKMIERTFVTSQGNASFLFIVSPEIRDDFEIFLEALQIENLQQRYEFIYDKACDYLDSQFVACNHCDFKDDKCVADRETKSQRLMGCCHSYELKSFFGIPFFKNEKVCEHLINRTCNTKNVSCKIFACKYLRKKGIYYNPKTNLYLNYFFNAKQLDVIRFNFFKTKEEIMDKLIKKDHTPYVWWIFTRRYKIK